MAQQQTKDVDGKRFAPRLLAALLVVAAGLKMVDLAFIELNRRQLILPRFDVSLIPYYDPRVTKRNALLLEYEADPRVIFTSDSRTKNNVDPEVVARELGVAPTTFFNFGTGSQVVRFAREAFVPHLQDIGVQPEFIVFGVSPDWPLQKKNLWKLIDRYRESPARRLHHPEEGGVDIETSIKNSLSRHLALFRYRTDLIHQEIVPNLRCWFYGDCFLKVRTMRITKPLHWKELERRQGFKTPYGWGPQGFDGHSTGIYTGHARFTEETPVDRENLIALIRQVRREGMTPLFLIMPVHPSFRQVHEPLMSRNQALLEEILRQEGADILYPRRDYSDPGLFVDGHHMSHRGAAYFSSEIGTLLEPYLETPNTQSGGRNMSR